MRIEYLDQMINGWFVGNFEPTIYKTNDVEVAVKIYSAGDYESAHYHKIATEISVVIKGEVEMNGVRYNHGNIIVMEPGECTDFKAITDVINVVVKIPGANNDKFQVN